VGVHVTEQRTEDTDCSEFRYFSCVLENGLEYALYSYEEIYFSLLFQGSYLVHLCRYRCM